MILALLVPASVSAEEGDDHSVSVYTVDLGRAVLGVPEGRKIRTELEKMRKSEERRVRRMEAALENDRARLSPSEFNSRFEAIQKKIGRAGRKLEAAQDRRLKPILRKMRSIMRAEEKNRAVVFDVSQRSPIGLSSMCDRTGQLSLVYRRGKGDLTFNADACRRTGFLYVNFDEIVKALPEGRDAVVKLDALQKKRQSELERYKSRLQTLKKRAKTSDDARLQEKVETRRAQLDALYQKYQKEIKDAEARAQSRLYRRIEAKLKQFGQAHDGLLFVEYFDSPPRDTRSCEVSEWAIAHLAGQAGLQALRNRCAWLQ